MVRVALAYVTMSWLVLQLVDVILNNVDAPAWMFQMILLLLGIGFLIAIFFSWAFELTPEGLKREQEIDRSESITNQTGRKLDRMIIVALVLALGYFVFDKFAPSTTDDAERSSIASGQPLAPGDTGQPGTATERKSIAVLPFTNMSGDQANEPFTLGIHDDLLTHLSRIKSLKTTSRTSVLQYRDTTKTIPQIAAELGVGSILEGGIQRSGNRVRINLQLINAETDEHLWAEIYDRELTAENLFAVQGEIATEVVKSLRATLLPEEQAALDKTPTQSMAAYDLYLLGRHHWQLRTAESIEKARDYFAAAIDEDPQYVLALSGLADSYALLDDYGNMEGGEAQALAQQAIDRAMALDDSVSEVWASQGLVYLGQEKNSEAEKALGRAIELDEQNFSAWLWYANAMGRIRRYDEQLVALQTAYALEPMYRPVNNNLAYVYQRRGDFARSRQHLVRVDELEDENPTRYKEVIANTWYWSGELVNNIVESRKILAIDPGNVDAMEWLADSYLILEDIEESERWAEEVAAINQFNITAYNRHLASGEFDQAIELIEDKLQLAGERRDLGYIFSLFRAAYMGGQIETARSYLSEYLGHLGGRAEIHPQDFEQRGNLLIADFLIRHGNESANEPGHGSEMLDEILAVLTNLNTQGFVHPLTYYGLAMARTMSGDYELALEALDEAVERGYRDRGRMTIEPGLAPLWDDERFEAIILSVNDLIVTEQEKLTQVSLATYTPLSQREQVIVAREILENYTGYYSDGNVVANFFLDEDGQFRARYAQVARSPVLFANTEDEFYDEQTPADTIRFHSDDAGVMTHVIFTSRGGMQRFKAVEPPPTAIELEHAMLERFEGIFAAQRVTNAQDGGADTDIWTCRISVDEQDRVWIDFDNQPALQIVPYSNTEFYLPGFIQKLRFEEDSGTGTFNRIQWIGDGSELEFIRQ